MTKANDFFLLLELEADYEAIRMGVLEEERASWDASADSCDSLEEYKVAQTRYSRPTVPAICWL
jgi:hypothetical protein